MGSVYALQDVGDLYVTTCGECGVSYAVLNKFDNDRRRDGRTFYCPNGHARVYRETTEQKRIKDLERQVAAERGRAERAETARGWAEKSAKGARIQAGKAKAAKERVIARVHAGVCPHCNRTFKQLAAHMKTKHQGAK